MYFVYLWALVSEQKWAEEVPLMFRLAAIDDHHSVGMIMVKKKKVAAVKVLDGGDYSDYSTIEAMYV